jgi:hypothetical protein
MKDRVGHHVGNPRLMSKLGRGGFAEMYLGEHIHLLTQAAVPEGEEGASTAR